MELAGLLLIPPLVGGILFLVFRSRITKKEFLLMEVIAVVILLGAWALARWGAMSDTENWNGRVTMKDHGSESCCHCYTVCDSRDKDGNCTSSHTVCPHFQDYYWALHFSTGDKETISSCEPSKSNVPELWTKAYLGEPASIPHRYTNYLKADPDSILHKGAKAEYMASIGGYPAVYGVYRTNKVVSSGVIVPPEWETRMKELNADLGGRHQIDVTLYFTRLPDPTFAEAVEAKWLYGPKNSVTVVMGVPDGKTIAWTRVVTISRVEPLKVGLRDGLTGMRLDQASEADALIRKEIREHFNRTPMAEYQYLASAAVPTTGMLIGLYIFALVLIGGLAAWLVRVDVFGDENRGHRYTRW
jgi:hypothetical protein